MATDFDVFYLGNLALIDPVEGDQNVDPNAVNSWLATYGASGNGLSGNVQSLTTGGTGYGGGAPGGYDLNNNASNDQMLIDGVTKTHDATMLFDATVTYPDGSTATITAVVFQTTDGDVYLAPEFSNNADQAALEAGPIQSITLNAPIYSNGITGRGYYLFADRANADFIPCFTPDTLIATNKGEVRVQDLKPGCKVFTRDNGIQELRWIGVRELDAQDLARSPDFQPVLIRKGAVGNGLPERDLLVSPNHRVLMTGANAALYFEDTEVLIAAKHMTMVEGIDQVQADAVTYIHLLFDRHEVILSNGTWTESFLPADYTLRSVGQDQRREIYALFPALRDIDTEDGWTAARRVLKRHEAELLLRDG